MYINFTVAIMNKLSQTWGSTGGCGHIGATLGCRRRCSIGMLPVKMICECGAQFEMRCLWMTTKPVAWRRPCNSAEVRAGGYIGSESGNVVQHASIIKFTIVIIKQHVVENAACCEDIVDLTELGSKKRNFQNSKSSFHDAESAFDVLSNRF